MREKCVFPECPTPTAPNLPGHIHVGDNPHVYVAHDDHAGEPCDNWVAWCHPRVYREASRDTMNLEYSNLAYLAAAERAEQAEKERVSVSAHMAKALVKLDAARSVRDALASELRTVREEGGRLVAALERWNAAWGMWSGRTETEASRACNDAFEAATALVDDIVARRMLDPQLSDSRCAAYDRHENPPNECCGCHYECGEYPEHAVHTDHSNPKFHQFRSARDENTERAHLVDGNPGENVKKAPAGPTTPSVLETRADQPRRERRKHNLQVMEGMFPLGVCSGCGHATDELDFPEDCPGPPAVISPRLKGAP